MNEQPAIFITHEKNYEKTVYARTVRPDLDLVGM